MWRHSSTTTVRHRLWAGLVLLGASTTGSVDVYHAYVEHQRRYSVIDQAQWDWTVPEDWYRQAHP
ncbi:hypothetical protein ACWEVD_16640 [Nocardia thailandica]